jgi:proteic killer suppression protein
MKLIFTNKFKYLDDDKEVVRKHGFVNAKKIINCLNALRVAHCLGDIIDEGRFRCHLLKADLSGCYALDIMHPHRMVIQPTNEPIPMKNNNEIDTSKVTEVKIVSIGDYHG